MIDQLDLRWRRVVWVGLMAFSAVCLLLNTLAAAWLLHLGLMLDIKVLTPVLLISALEVGWLLPFASLALAAVAAVTADLRGGYLTFAVGWWITNIVVTLLVGLVAGHVADRLVSAATFNVVVLGATGAVNAPRFLINLGVSPRISVGAPWILPFVMACFFLARKRLRPRMEYPV